MDKKILTIRRDGEPCYDIWYEDAFQQLPDSLAASGCAGRRALILTDENVAPLYAGEVLQEVEKACPGSMAFALPAGEAHKTLDQVREAYRFLIENHFDRTCLIVALGGGVIGDMAGYVAATFLRGVDFVQVPTTLLAQADSSIGGKTGVDFDGFKNMVGAFKMPRLVYANVSALKTLEDRQFVNGFAEVIKHGIIRDADYYAWLIGHRQAILDRRPQTLQPMLRRSNEIKKAVVENDPYEKGERMLLNFGHTIGHAIEKQSGFAMLHGECVALGCVAAACLSRKRGLIGEEDCHGIRDMFLSFGLPASLGEGADPAEIVRLTKSDKKMKDGQIRFILLRRLGDAFVAPDVTEEEIEEAVRLLAAIY